MDDVDVFGAVQPARGDASGIGRAAAARSSARLERGDERVQRRRVGPAAALPAASCRCAACGRPSRAPRACAAASAGSTPASDELAALQPVVVAADAVLIEERTARWRRGARQRGCGACGGASVGRVWQQLAGRIQLVGRQHRSPHLDSLRPRHEAAGQRTAPTISTRLIIGHGAAAEYRASWYLTHGSRADNVSCRSLSVRHACADSRRTHARRPDPTGCPAGSCRRADRRSAADPDLRLVHGGGRAGSRRRSARCSSRGRRQRRARRRRHGAPLGGALERPRDRRPAARAPAPTSTPPTTTASRRSRAPARTPARRWSTGCSTAGANPNLAQKSGLTPLMIAARTGNVAVVQGAAGARRQRQRGDDRSRGDRADVGGRAAAIADVARAAGRGRRRRARARRRRASRR